MEIIVEGSGTDYFVPDQVDLNLNFKLNGLTYNEVFEKGSNSIIEFINTILMKNGFKKEDLKTRSFVIKEEKEYDHSGKYKFIGYSYNQEAILKFDYNKVKLAKMISEIALLKNPPFYSIGFSLKNEKECFNTLIKKAYDDAFNKASMIAISSGKTLKDCVKVDFKPLFDFANSSFDAKSLRLESNNPSLENVFTPEDIKLTETLYCKWIAE